MFPVELTHDEVVEALHWIPKGRDDDCAVCLRHRAIREKLTKAKDFYEQDWLCGDCGKVVPGLQEDCGCGK
jgi:hypothetical protein